MKLLYGQEPAEFLKVRHSGQVAGLATPPKLAIIRSKTNPAGDRYLKMKQAYGSDIGVLVDLYVETSATIQERIKQLNADPSVTGIIIQLPLEDEAVTAKALAAVAPSKDVDGLSPHSPFESATPKAVLWLLAAYDVDVAGHIVIVGQGRLVGKPLAARLEAAAQDVRRLDIHTTDLKSATLAADMIITGTGKPGLIRSDMVKAATTVIDTGAPSAELEPALYDRTDLTAITPNPGGVGPMTVATLFDNLLIAAELQKTTLVNKSRA